MPEIIELPAIKPIVDPVLKEQLSTLIDDQEIVIVHCQIKALSEDMGIRIWKSTYLCENNSSHRSKLIHAENITIFPYWTLVNNEQIHHFTLYFSGLSKKCTSFDLIEFIPENGGFEKLNIQRNKENIYHVNFNE
jgi:hypothetical protein